jgi:2-oxoglutarate ferredoxin oxidoreductase subunit alpha
MNPETAREDCLELEPGGVLVYDEPLKLNELRSDIHMYPVPFDKLVGPVCPDAKLRKLVKNMLYDGVVAYLLDIDMEEIHKALFKQFGPKKVRRRAELGRGAGGLIGRSPTRRKTIPSRERMNANGSSSDRRQR